MRRNVFFTIMIMALTVTAFTFLAQKPVFAKDYTIRLLLEAAEGEAFGLISAKFKEEVEKRTEGHVKVNLFYSSSLAGGQEALQMVQMGSAEMYQEIPGAVGSLMMPELMVFDMPYLFRDRDHVKAVFNSPIMAGLSEKLVKKTGLRILDATTAGFRAILAKKPYPTPEDLKGAKIRSAEIALNVAMWKALGANPVTIGFAELYTSLATNVADGFALPPRIAWMYKFGEVTPYVNMTNHQAFIEMYLINDKFLKSLPKEYQKAVIDSSKIANDYGNKILEEKYLPEAMEGMKKDGMKIIEVDRAAYEKKFVGFEKQFIPKTFSQELFDSIKNYK